MKPAPFHYLRPDTLSEAVEALAGTPGAKVLAGGQSLVPLLSMRLAAPDALVDVNGLDELSYVRAEEGGVRVGALARHSDVEHDTAAARVQPLLARALRLVAHPTIRNRGTTVGSLVHADPSAELPAVLALLGGHVTVVSTRGRRMLPAGELYVGPLETSLTHDEVAVEAFFPALAPGAGTAVEEVARRHGDYALCGVAALVETDEGRVTGVRAAYLSVADVPTVVALGPALVDPSGSPPVQSAYDDAADLALGRLDPPEDIHATAAYRSRLVRVLTRRAVTAAVNDAGAAA